MHVKQFVAFIIIVLSCMAPARADEPSGEMESLVNGSNAFAVKLYAQLLDDRSTNVFLSPYSVSSAMSLALAGAAGETEREIAGVLQGPLPQEKFHRAFAALQKAINNREYSPDVQLHSANRLWANQTLHVLPQFLQTTRDNYGAELAQLDFTQPDAACGAINAWIEQHTANRIRDLVSRDSINSGTQLVLTNAIYFKAPWSFDFDKKYTVNAPFHLSASKKVTVSTMRQTERLAHVANEEAQILQLPYSQSRSLSMLIVLPNKTDGLRALEKNLTAEKLQRWTEEMDSREVHVFLPKFKLTSTFELGDTLASMGMASAFSSQANFSRITTDGPLQISRVIHKAFVDVDEQGTEAAAATAVMMFLGAMPPSLETPVTFRADHPFLFLIRHNETNSILFMGRVTNPQQ